MENLIVISQKNQATRMLRFLQQTDVGLGQVAGLVNNSEILFLDWGDTEAKTPKQIIELADFLGCPELTRIAIPRSAHVITKARYRDFSALYRKYLDSHGAIRQALLFSYEGHYALLCQMLQDSGASVSIFEDGLGMYVHGMDNNRVKVTGILGTINHSSRRLVGSMLNRETNGTTSKKIIRWLREMYWGFFGPTIPNQNLLISGFRDFKNSYSSFPELAKKLFPNAKQQYVPFAEAMINDTLRTKDIKKSVPMGPEDTLFLAQTYLFGDDEVHKILKTALKISPKKMWIKLHPRTDKDMVKQFKRIAKTIDKKRIKFCKFKAPAENLIASLEPGKVISLTSTSLTYVQQLSPDSESISLADYAIDLLEKSSDRRASRTLETLSADRAVLEYFSDVNVYVGAKNK